MRFVLLAGVAALMLAGCQSTEESMNNAEQVCHQQGLKTGTKQYQRCVNATYQSNRRQDEQATNAAVLAGVAGVAGGVIAGAAASHPYYHHNYYYCRGWGCY